MINNVRTVSFSSSEIKEQKDGTQKIMMTHMLPDKYSSIAQFQIRHFFPQKNCWYFLISPWKQMLWTLIRSSYFHEEIRKKIMLIIPLIWRKILCGYSFLSGEKYYVYPTSYLVLRYSQLSLSQIPRGKSFWFERTAVWDKDERWNIRDR